MWLKDKRGALGLVLIIVAIQLLSCKEVESPPEEEPVLLEEVEGSDFNRVILTERAFERLGIETTVVHEGELTNTQTVEGQVVAQRNIITNPGDSLIRVALDKGTMSKVNSAQAARILLQIEDDDDDGFLAELFELPDSDDDDDDDDDEGEEILYFVLDSALRRVNEGQTVFVKLALTEGEHRGLVVPYSAVIYGLNGETWTYINPEPFTYMRQPITVDYIKGGEAFLSDGPPAGVAVVTVGAQMLYGADTGVGK